MLLLLPASEASQNAPRRERCQGRSPIRGQPDPGLAGAFQESVDEYAAIPKRMHARGVLTAATAARLESLAGFRDILVHDYADVDLKRVHVGLQRLDDFDAFVGDVDRWLQAANPNGK